MNFWHYYVWLICLADTGGTANSPAVWGNFIAMQILPMILQKMFFLIPSRWRRHPCGREDPIHHKGIKIYWKCLFYLFISFCSQNNCYIWTEYKNLAFLPMLNAVDTCFPCISGDPNLLDMGRIYIPDMWPQTVNKTPSLPLHATAAHTHTCAHKS